MEICIDRVEGRPPIKNEALSLFSKSHRYWPEVERLLAAAKTAVAMTGWRVRGVTCSLGLEVVMKSPGPPPGDATNYLGGIGDVLEAKSRRAGLPDLGDLLDVALYENDRSIHEVRYVWTTADEVSYSVRIWERQDA